MGGFQAVTNALERLVTDLDVDIRCDTTVTGVTNDGVWLQSSTNHGDDTVVDNEFISADLIIVNADLPYAKKSLLIDNNNTDDSNDSSANKNKNIRNENKDIQQLPLPLQTDKFDWDDSFSFSSGVVSFYWSLDKSLDELNTHNVFLSTGTRSQAEASWQVLRDEQSQQDVPENSTEDEDDAPFNFYVHRPSKIDPSVAPPGCDTLMVLVPCKTLLRDEECGNLPRKEAMDRYQQQFPPEVVSQIRQAVLKRFTAVESLKNLEDQIIHEEYKTPATWADQYNVAAGTPFGLVSCL
jgi:phytoene dehydrogenase-like protein